MTCAYCDDEATRLCDGIIAYYRDDEGMIVDPDNPLGCDAPLCDDHATSHGHVCGPEGCDTFDYCPPCAAKKLAKRPEPTP